MRSLTRTFSITCGTRRIARNSLSGLPLSAIIVSTSSAVISPSPVVE